MTDQKQVLGIIYNAIDTLNEEMEDNDQIEKTENAILFGSNSGLDSMGLVNLITLIEQNIEEATGKFISIADERAMSLEESPFRTVSSLKEYITTLLNEN